MQVVFSDQLNLFTKINIILLIKYCMTELQISNAFLSLDLYMI